ncbi:MAG: hypothetical protein GX410_01185 [Elusimicrobia bacterium]|nr:hypothetical protein [Elusimicrobiota bacterium]
MAENIWSSAARDGGGEAAGPGLRQFAARGVVQENGAESGLVVEQPFKALAALGWRGGVKVHHRVGPLQKHQPVQGEILQLENGIARHKLLLGAQKAGLGTDVEGDIQRAGNGKHRETQPQEGQRQPCAQAAAYGLPAATGRFFQHGMAAERLRRTNNADFDGPCSTCPPICGKIW